MRTCLHMQFVSLQLHGVRVHVDAAMQPLQAAHLIGWAYMLRKCQYDVLACKGQHV